MNKVILTGRPTDKPEIRRTQEGKAIARWTLAVNRNKDAADFISCNAFGVTAEFVEKYVEKGKLIALEGRIKTGSYEKDERKIYTTDIIAEKIEFCEKKGESKAESKDSFMDIPDGLEEFPFL